ncbi:mechanosensitive ion channel family protein [Peribacillus muralis]|uniref:mechanosensitive ion channel family protein n=1 Tax=Peribacillus muralis TaxID=264697 RepID=UPI00070AA2F9|nr:mechanosensitive ion channel family protein [Peribacillus muralis]MCK1994709.1 mechanosensitive ion channel family protein [Peribacillus muralis]MCK2015056.1 mechanosensitive ion channel family protein [Peribacillus muralis]
MNRMYDNVTNELLNEKIWLLMGEGIIKIFLVLLLSRIIITIGKTLLNKFFKARSRSPIRVSERRETTLIKLLENIITYVINFIALMMILEIFGLHVMPLLAGAGVIGLAIGFGAQSLVKDIITGFFVIFEDQFSVGDYIKINTYEGEVIEIGLRTTKMKSNAGELHFIPNGSIIQVTNYSILNSKAVVDVTINNDGSIERVERVLIDLLNSMEGQYDALVKAPEFLGIETINPDQVVLRVTAETKPLQNVEFSRILRKEISAALDLIGVKSTYSGSES